MRNLIVAITAFALLVGGLIVYLETDKREFIDGISVPPVVDQPVNRTETTRESTREDDKPKLHKMDPEELIAALSKLPEEFGYSEAAETYAKLEAKRLEEGLTIDEDVARLEAQLYLYPDENTRRSLILQRFVQSKGPNFHPRHGFSEEDIAQLQELGIPVVWRGNMMIVNPAPDTIGVDKIFEEKYGHVLNDPKYFPSNESAPNTVSSGSIDEHIEAPPTRPARSEMLPATSEPHALEMSEHAHLEDGHVHEPSTIQPPTPADSKSVEARGWEGLSQEQREQAKAFFDQYGTAEGLRRFREMDPEAAAGFERERREPPVHSEPDDKSSTR